MENRVRKLTCNSFWKNIAVNGDMMIDERTDKFIGPECYTWVNQHLLKM